MLDSVSRPKTSSLECPRCGRPNIKANTLADVIYLVGIDPLSGEVKKGMVQEIRPTECVDLYVCTDCGYESAASWMFVKEDCHVDE